MIHDTSDLPYSFKGEPTRSERLRVTTVEPAGFILNREHGDRCREQKSLFQRQVSAGHNVPDYIAQGNTI